MNKSNDRKVEYRGPNGWYVAEADDMGTHYQPADGGRYESRAAALAADSAPTQPTAAGEAAHTPLPFSLRVIGGSADLLLYSESAHYPIARILAGDALVEPALALSGDTEEAGVELKANAELIIRAVNSHAALVAALENIDRDLTTLLCGRSLDSTTLAFREVRKNRDSARAALKQAE